MLGTVLLAGELSPTYLSPRFMARIERLAGYKLGEGGFVEVGVSREELETDSAVLTRREWEMQAEELNDFAATLQFSSTISVNEWWGRVLRRVVRPRGPLVVLSGQELKGNIVEGCGWQLRRGLEGKMVEAAGP